MNKRKVYTVIKDGRPFTYNGYRCPLDDGALITDLPKEKYEEAIGVLSAWFMKATKTSYRHSSYGMKHWLEDALDCYVSNNQLKDAMLILGFGPSDWEELNWYFKVKPTPELRRFLSQTNRLW